MALLQSLQICGIRSFSPDSKETIYFTTPVTLFLGQNGCGKTTIIECIRHALTSELPAGTNNGQGFLNEPKIFNKNTTKGLINIKFLDAQENEIIISKQMSVSAKTGGGLTFKKLAATIRKRDKNDPRPQDISGRCVDVDNYCCTALNVSKTILNNVIFCHQENSSWPLDEPKKLKEKFDEIFDAVKYNKCIESTRKYIKEKQARVTVLRERLAHKKSVKEDVEKKRGRYDEKKEKLQEVKESIQKKESDIEPMEDRMKKILDLEVSLSTIQKELTKREVEKKGVIDQQISIKDHISYVFEGSDEELKDKIKSFKKEQENDENSIKDLEKRKKEIISKTNVTGENIQRVQVKIGQLKEEQNQQNKRVDEMKDLVEKARVKLQINNFNDVNNSELVLDELRGALEISEDRLESLKNQKDAEEKDLQNKIDDVKEKYVRTKQNISSKKSLIEESKTKIKDINNKLEQLDTSDSQLKIVGDKIVRLQDTLKKLKDSINEAEKLQEIEDTKDLIQKKKKAIEKLEKEYKILQQNYLTEQKIESEKSMIIEKQGEINRIKNKNSENFQKLFDGNLPERNFKRSVVEIQNREEKKCKSITDKVNKLQKQLATSEANVRHQKKQLDSIRKELQANKQKVQDLCKGRPFNEVLNESDNKRKKLQKDKGQYSSAKIMYEAFINKFEKEAPCCPVCQTDFTDKSAKVKEIIQQLKNRIERIPGQLLQIDVDLNKEEEMYNKLQQLKPVNDNIEMLAEAKIPLAEEELGELTQKTENLSKELNTEKENLVTPQSLVDACKLVITDVPLLDQYLADINRAKETVEDLESNIVKVASNRSRQEAEAEIDEVKSELSNLENQYDSMKSKLDSHRDRCQSLNTEIQRETQKQIDMQKLVQEKPLLEKQKVEHTNKIKSLKEEVEQLNESLVGLERDLNKAKDNKSHAVAANRKLIEEERNKLFSNKTIITSVQKLKKSIDAYVSAESEKKLDDTITELADLNNKLDKFVDAKNKIDEAISEKKQGLAKQQNNYRALLDNETLREIQTRETFLTSEIDRLKKQIGDANPRSVYEEKQRLQKQIDTSRREINLLIGQKEEISKQLREIQEELESPKCKNAFNDYKKQYYEVEILKMALEDLNVYITTLEKAVLQFHKERMVQINKTIRELWRNIYRGNDIDYIEIQSDDQGIGGNKRRTYNYKVVEVKKGVELDMRGRCSAGQKVLACLVIRMALAETFSSNCGILALDEPTTNLDRENILSLSDALSRIIQAREKEKSFQLLIITHDEEFLDNLTRQHSLDSYWRVKRNEEGFSTVQRHML